MRRAHVIALRQFAHACRRLDRRGIALLGLLMVLAPSAEAYVGPGSGLTAIGTLLAFLGAIVLGIFGFVWYPLKRLRARLRRRAEHREPVE